MGKELTAADILVMPRLTSLAPIALSPEGRLIAFSVDRGFHSPQVSEKQPAAERDESFEQRTELWVTNLRTKKEQRVCCEQGSATLPSWSPDGKYLAFYRSKRSQADLVPGTNSSRSETSIAIWNRDTGALQEFLEGALGMQSSLVPACWIDYGNRMLVLVEPTNKTRYEFKDDSDNLADQHPALGLDILRDPSIRTMTSYTEDDHPLSPLQDSKHQISMRKYYESDLAILDFPSGGLTRILRNFHPVYSALSPDHSKFAYANYEGTVSNSFYQSLSIHLLDLGTLQDRIVEALNISNAADNRGPFFSWSPDSHFLSFVDEHAAANVKDGYANKLTDLVLLEVNDGTWRRTKTESRDTLGTNHVVVWSSAGGYFSIVRSNTLETWDSKSFTNLSTVSIPSKELLDIVSTHDHQVLARSGSDYSLVLRVRDTETMKAEFWQVWPIANHKLKLLDGDKSFTTLYDYQELLPDGSKVVFVWGSAERLPEIYEAGTLFNVVKEVTNLGSELRHCTLGRSKIISWRKADGIQAKGALLLPADYSPNHKYPLIVSVYPLPDQSHLVNEFGMQDHVGPFDNWQIFASRGYAVLIPDISANPKSRMVDMMNAVLPGILKVMDLGIADPERIGVTGVSAGGYASLALIVQSKIFSAAIMVSGLGNLLEQYSYDFGQRVMEENWGFRTTPWKDRDAFIKDSPYFYLNEVQSPLLIITGSADQVVPAHLGEEIFNGLRRLHKEAVYVQFEGEAHVPDSYSAPHQLLLSDLMIRWFDRYLKGQASYGRVPERPLRTVYSVGCAAGAEN